MAFELPQGHLGTTHLSMAAFYTPTNEQVE